MRSKSKDSGSSTLDREPSPERHAAFGAFACPTSAPGAFDFPIGPFGFPLGDGPRVAEHDASGLQRKLEQALRKLDQGKVTSVISKLQDFIAQVSDFVLAGKLTTAQGQPLIDAAQDIIDSLGG